jgi:hypothetical protein
MGHEVLLIGNGDGFKKYETDIKKFKIKIEKLKAENIDIKSQI